MRRVHKAPPPPPVGLLPVYLVAAADRVSIPLCGDCLPIMGAIIVQKRIVRLLACACCGRRNPLVVDRVS